MILFSNWFFILFICVYFLYLFVEVGLDILNLNYIAKRASKIPPLFEGVFSKDDYKKSIEYTKAKTHFRIFSIIAKTIFLFVLIFSGAFLGLDRQLSSLLPNYPFLHAAAYPFYVGAIFYLFGLPESYYYQFVLEERFGFNRMDVKTFLLDQFKNILLSLALGVPLIMALLWIIQQMGSFWWLFGFALLMFFQLFTAAIYPVVLAPIFNKFTPLPEGSLKSRIVELAKKVHFKMAGIFTIDGSKRSSHSNAFFAGLGAMRRIVLFDTLVDKHTEDEIIAVIAHEMGHNVKRHIQKGLIVSSIVTLAGFYALAFFLKWPLFFHAFGVDVPSIHVGLVLFALFAPVFLFPIAPIFTKRSRKNEYEADHFSVITTRDKKSLADALVKLTKENLGNLTPHPWYSAYHYSHPTTLERVQAIDKISLEKNSDVPCSTREVFSSN